MRGEANQETAPYTVFMGGPTCVYHNMMGMDRSRTTFITPHKNDVAQGKVPEMIQGEVGKMVCLEGARQVRVFTSCFGEFIGVDYESLCVRLSMLYDIDCWHEKRCRICMKSGMGMHGRPRQSPGMRPPMHHMKKFRGGDEGLGRHRPPRPMPEHGSGPTNVGGGGLRHV